MLYALKNLNIIRIYPGKFECKEGQINFWNNVKKVYDGRKIIVDAFKNKMFPFKRKDPEDKYENEPYIQIFLNCISLMH